jgi:2'-5' RNA ligase superfamily
MPFEAGESALVVPVPAAEPVVGTWRARLDSSAAYGMPAHLTVLYPFLNEHLLTGTVLEQLRLQSGRHGVSVVRFERTGRFPGVLYLDPEPVEHVAQLICGFAEGWPQAPPYGGAHPAVVPHLTVAEGADVLLDEVEQQVQPALPLVTLLESVALYVFGDTGWQPRAQFPFRGPTAHRGPAVCR